LPTEHLFSGRGIYLYIRSVTHLVLHIRSVSAYRHATTVMAFSVSIPTAHTSLPAHPFSASRAHCATLVHPHPTAHPFRCWAGYCATIVQCATIVHSPLLCNSRTPLAVRSVPGTVQQSYTHPTVHPFSTSRPAPVTLCDHTLPHTYGHTGRPFSACQE
jgi:hypothetical protein